ncbi:MAG: glycosyltransferase, partial [Candidatus Sericytochromatia bacterium]
MSLSVCIITKNEENNISKCIESIYDIADEIIITDTGSTDKTIEIASKFDKVKVFNFDWENDNSKARNYCISHAKSNWILVLDADEQLDKNTSANMNHFILDHASKYPLKSIFAFVSINKNKYSLEKEYYKSSLFRNNIGIKYVNPIHDFPFIEGFKYVKCSNMYINHENGSTKEYLLEKNNKYIKRIEEIIKNGLGNSYYYKHLGDSYLLSGDNKKAKNNYLKAKELLPKNISIDFVESLDKNIKKLSLKKSRKLEISLLSSLIILTSCISENNLMTTNKLNQNIVEGLLTGKKLDITKGYKGRTFKINKNALDGISYDKRWNILNKGFNIKGNCPERGCYDVYWDQDLQSGVEICGTIDACGRCSLYSYEEVCNPGTGGGSGGNGDEPDCGNDTTFSITALNPEQKDNLKYLRDIFKIYTEVDKINKYQYEITKTYNQAYYTQNVNNNYSIFTELSNKLRDGGEVNVEYISKLDKLENSLNQIVSTNVFSENIEIKNNIANRILDLKIKFSNTPKIYEQFNLSMALVELTNEYEPILNEYNNYRDVIVSKIRLLSKEKDKESKLKDIGSYTLKIKSVFEKNFGGDKLNKAIYTNYLYNQYLFDARNGIINSAFGNSSLSAVMKETKKVIAVKDVIDKVKDSLEIEGMYVNNTIEEQDSDVRPVLEEMMTSISKIEQDLL